MEEIGRKESQSLVVSLSSVKQRIASLDLLRGLAIFLMVIVNSLFDYTAIPSWLKHAPWNGYTLSDLVAPMFLFSIGISYSLSFNKRMKTQGALRTIFHFILRYVILFCFGFFGEWVVLGKIGWGVLTMIGAVGIYSLAFMFLKPLPRVVLSVIPFITYEILVYFRVPIVLFVDGGLGGPAATVAWGFIVIAASSTGNWIHDKAQKTVTGVLGIQGAVLTALGIGLSFLLPFNKHLVSASYILFSTGVSALMMLLFYFLADIWKWKIPVLPVIGRNALVIYILSNLLILGLNAVIPLDASLLWVIFGTAAVTGICIGVGFFLDWRKWYIRL